MRSYHVRSTTLPPHALPRNAPNETTVTPEAVKLQDLVTGSEFDLVAMPLALHRTVVPAMAPNAFVDLSAPSSVIPEMHPTRDSPDGAYRLPITIAQMAVKGEPGPDLVRYITISLLIGLIS